MRAKKSLTFVLFLLVIIITACSSPKPVLLPTTIPVAELPTLPPPIATTLPATTDLTALTVTPPPTPIPATQPPQATRTPAEPFIGIASVQDGDEFMLGREVSVRGLLQRPSTTSAWLALMSWNGRLLIETEAAANDQSWEAAFTIPPHVSGAAYLQASLRDEAGEIVADDRVDVALITDTTVDGRYLALARPVLGETAVPGFNLFFDGAVYRPVDSVITISVWVDDCQTRVAQQSFVLGRSTYPIYWQGFTVVPQDATGPACAVAHTGEPGSEDWREAVIPINILPPDDVEAKGITIGSPPPESHVAAGRELLLYGTALNVSEKPVSVRILMENGRIISQETAPADYWGYWEFRVAIPPDVFGPAKVTVSTGDEGGDNYAEAQILINVDPAPTPES